MSIPGQAVFAPDPGDPRAEVRTPLVDLGRTVLRGWLLILVAVVLCTGVGVLVRVAVVTPKYEATSIYTVQPLDGNNSDISMETEQVIVTSNSVLNRALKALPGETLQSLKGSLKVTVPQDSDALQITASATTPSRAADAANAVAAAYQDNRVTSAHQTDDAAVQDLNNRIDQLRATLAGLRRGSSQAATVRAQISALEGQVTTLQSRAIYPGQVVSRAIRPRSPSTPGLPVFVVAGFVFGIIAGFFLALLVDRVRTELALSRPAGSGRYARRAGRRGQGGRAPLAPTPPGPGPFSRYDRG